MKFSQEEIISTLDKTGLVLVFHGADPESAREVMAAAYGAGIRAFEFLNREENALEVYRELYLHAQQYQDLVLGVGSVFSDEEARRFLGIGADFVVSPAFIPTVAIYCNSKQVMWIPGCGTATEIFNAGELGAQIVKAFPGQVLGPAFISEIRQVFPHLQLIGSGGIEPTEMNLGKWFGAGAICIDLKYTMEGAGSQSMAYLTEVLTLIEKIKQK